jgi:hypothetical protein
MAISRKRGDSTRMPVVARIKSKIRLEIGIINAFDLELR